MCIILIWGPLIELLWKKKKKKEKGLGIKYKRVPGMVWCGEIMGDSGFKEVRAGVLVLGARLID